ncbi:DUF3052 domain-containing protein [Rarobacter faecitabidus]|uniref:DUF3052 family protein n=1 Tax=Rarobacter faecitabidus TaxID=13243 RepID=A0A542ZV20_RARFA|nr:DUF3052 domain-containing protein [Rarobacter faecitabidus]TQL64213.1 DUF3052 family protein [Rarobacter faecitabidus]
MAPSTDSIDIAPLGLEPGQIVQEFGWDEDVDDDLRLAIEALIGSELVDEDYGAVTDAVIAWFRDEDEDLTDLLVDVQTVLKSGGLVWLLTPKTGRAGHVAQGDIVEAATTAGLHATKTLAIAPEWSAAKLVSRGATH